MRSPSLVVPILHFMYTYMYLQFSGNSPTVRTQELYGWMHEQHVVLLLSMRLTGTFAPSFIFSSLNLTFVFADELSGWRCRRAQSGRKCYQLGCSAAQQADNTTAGQQSGEQCHIRLPGWLCLFGYFVWLAWWVVLWASYLDVSERARYKLMTNGVSMCENVSEWASELVQWLPW